MKKLLLTGLAIATFTLGFAQENKSEDVQDVALFVAQF